MRDAGVPEEVGLSLFPTLLTSVLSGNNRRPEPCLHSERQTHGCMVRPRPPIVATEPSPAISQLNILQLVLIHPEIVAQFMDNRPADLFADFGLAGADRFNILLIEHDVITPCR